MPVGSDRLQLWRADFTSARQRLLQVPVSADPNLPVLVLVMVLAGGYHIAALIQKRVELRPEVASHEHLANSSCEVDHRKPASVLSAGNAGVKPSGQIQ